MRSVRVLLIAILFLPGVRIAVAVERFPPPEFKTHELPPTEAPPPEATWQEYMDVAVLVAALAVSSYLALRARSRRGILLLTVLSLAYFGFWRKGCVCPIGSIQNVSLALFEQAYAVPLTVAAFFLLPLVFTLFFGRTFCGGVCPLGAIQDLVLVRPVGVPRWLEHGLRLGAYVYLGLAVLFAATASAFVICEYDPFVAFFRLSGSSGMLLLGAGLLVLGMFVGRPYCRFLCPYGVLLGLVSRVSRWSVTITPDSCVRCKLCEDECPFGAIEVPTSSEVVRPEGPGRKSVLVLIMLLPLLVVLGGLLGAGVAGPLSMMHATVRLAERVRLEEEGKVEGTTDVSAAFRATGLPSRELYADALIIKDRYRFASPILGAYVGLAIAIKLLQAVLQERRKDYEVRRSTCLSCGRCFFYCPQEHARLKQIGITMLPDDVSRQL